MTTNGFIRVSIPTKATWGVGQHFFVRFVMLGIHMGSIHPFTACSLPAEGASSSSTTSELVLYIRAQKGLTARLARLASANPDAAVRVLLDGPYGGVDVQKLVTSERQVMIAGGSGAGWLMAMITAFLRKHRSQVTANGVEANSSAKVVLATRDVTTQAWFEETITELLSTFGIDKLPDNLSVELHYTGSQQAESAAVTHSLLEKLDIPEIEKSVGAQQSVNSTKSDTDSSTSDPARTRHVKHFGARPDLAALIHSEAVGMPSDVSKLGVFVCGPLSMQNDVSNAVASEQIAILNGAQRDIYLHMEHFSWA